MARTNLPTTSLTYNGGIAQPAGTTIDQANGMNVVTTAEAVPSEGTAAGHLILQVTNSAASAKHCIVRAGVTPPAQRSALGDLSISVAAGATELIGPLESMRFAQSDGSINVDFDSGMTGTINALLVPRNF